MKILIIQTASIGDVILATALIDSLHQGMPGISIDFLVKKGNEHLFDGHPYLGKVIAWNKQSKKYSDFLKILRDVRKSRYDLVINIQRFFMTGLLTVLSGALETRGFSKNPLSFLFSRSYRHEVGAGKHEVLRNQLLISDLVTPARIKPVLVPQQSDIEFINRYANELFYTISPASLWFTKQFPVEKWVELIKVIPDSATVYLLGAPNDMDLCNEIILKSGHPRIISLAGKLTLLQSAALMIHARMNFTNDSAPMHLASAVDAPVTAVYCSTVPEFGFGPLSANSSIAEIGGELSCRPCGLHGRKACPKGHFRCALGIEPEALTSRL